MSITHSISISTSRKTIFERYEDVASWPIWDHSIADVVLSDGLKPGSEGWLKPQKGPKARILVTQVEPGRSFLIESRLPLCRVYFDHELEGDASSTTATHSVRFSGPLSFLFRRLIGQEINATLPDTLRGLKRACEAKAIAGE